MFKSISKRNFWMIAKNATLAMAVVLGFALNAKAEDTETNETLQVSCSPFSTKSLDAQCNSSNLFTQPEAEQIAQRRGRNRKSKVDGYYGGVTLGVGFGSGELDLEVDGTDNPEYGNSFLISFFEGIKFNKNLSADLEFLLAFGGVDSDNFDDSFNQIFIDGFGVDTNLETDSDYSTFALYINPRFELPLANKGKFNLYISPGIGISQTNVNFQTASNAPELVTIDEDGNEVDNNVDINNDASATGFTFQIKGGASLAITESIQAIAQARYISLSTDDPFDSIGIFGVDGGLKLNF